MAAATPDGAGGSAAPKKKKRQVELSRDIVIKRLNKKMGQKKLSPLAQLQEIFEETTDKARFVGDTMFWKYFEDIEIQRIYHPTSVEYMNLKVMFWETLFYLVLLIIFTAYVYSLQSRDVYDARLEQVNYWSGCDAAGVCKIDEVENMASFWNFMHGEFVHRAFTEYPDPQQKVASIPTNFPANEFPIIWHPRFVGPGKSNVLLGTIRVRQLRVMKNAGCQVSKLFAHLYPDCYGPYQAGVASQRNYMPRFAPTYLSEAYTYVAGSATAQAALDGSMGDYGSDGFMFDLPWNASDSRMMLGDLWHWSWLDRASRAVIVELSTLNTNINVIVNTRLLFEFGPTGSVVGTVHSTGARAFFFTPSTSSGAATSVFAMQIVLLWFFWQFTLYCGWLIFKTTKNFIGDDPIKFLRKQTCMGKINFVLHTFYHYLRYGWNLVDLLILALFYTHMGLRISAYVSISGQPDMAPNVIGHPEKFMPFSMVMRELVHGNNVLSILAILMWVKLFKYLCMSSYFRLLVRILELCAAKLIIFSVLLVCIFFGFAVALFVGKGGTEDNYSGLGGSFLVGFFLLIDGYSLNEEWFEPGRDWIMPLVYFVYIALIYFVLMNISVAIVLDVYATADRTAKEDKDRKNPMLVFLYTYYKMMLGISLVRDDAEENMRSEDLNIELALLPGVVRRKWIEKKRKLQRIANESFAGMELFDGDVGEDKAVTMTDWMLPCSRTDVFGNMGASAKKPLSIYDVPQGMLKNLVSRAQLQRLMDEDPTLPILLQEARAEKVIARFKAGAKEPPVEAVEDVGAVKKLQGQVFGEIDALERVQLDDDIPEVREITKLTEEMSDAITTVRNQFRLQLTGIIEATAVLFEHLVELTQGIDAVRQNHEMVVDKVRQKAAEFVGTTGSNFMKR